MRKMYIAPLLIATLISTLVLATLFLPLSAADDETTSISFITDLDHVVGGTLQPIGFPPFAYLLAMLVGLALFAILIVISFKRTRT